MRPQPPPMRDVIFRWVWGIALFFGTLLLLSALGLEELSCIVGGLLFLLVIYGPLYPEDEKAPPRRTDAYRYPRSPSAYFPGWEQLRQQALERDRHKCGNCGKTYDLHVHHIMPRSKGGADKLSNLKTLCMDCHKKLHPHMK